MFIMKKNFKNKISFALAAILMLGCVTPVSASPFGDADEDGDIDAADAAMVLQKALKSTFEVPAGFDYIDVDIDNKITAADSAAILQKTLKSTYEMPVEKMQRILADTERVYTNEKDNTKYLVYDIGEGGFDEEFDGHGCVVEGYQDLKEKVDKFLPGYSNMLEKTNGFFNEKYDEEFFKNNFLVMSATMYNDMAPEFAPSDVTVSGDSLAIVSKENLNNGSGKKYFVRLVEVNKSLKKDKVNWIVEDTTASGSTINTNIIFPEQGDNKLVINKTGWAYPNHIYWELANYPEDQDEKYVVDIYKNGELFKTINCNLPAKNSTNDYPKDIRKSLDISDIIASDTAVEYSFGVKALGDGVNTFDSDYVYDSKHIYVPDTRESGKQYSVTVSDKGTVQVKTFNIALPTRWIHNPGEGLELVSAYEYDDTCYYDENFDRTEGIPGGENCKIYNYKTSGAGTFTIEFVQEKIDDGTVLQQENVEVVVG